MEEEFNFRRHVWIVLCIQEAWKDYLGTIKKCLTRQNSFVQPRGGENAAQCCDQWKSSQQSNLWDPFGKDIRSADVHLPQGKAGLIWLHLHKSPKFLMLQSNLSLPKLTWCCTRGCHRVSQDFMGFLCSFQQNSGLAVTYKNVKEPDLCKTFSRQF